MIRLNKQKLLEKLKKALSFHKQFLASGGDDKRVLVKFYRKIK